MSIIEFDSTLWSQYTQVYYKGKVYDILDTNTDEKLVFIQNEKINFWVRCENVEVCPY